MSEGQVLFQAILQEPDADLPRLMFADWLEEHGGNAERLRAEFIRVQVELAHTPAATTRYWELLAQEQRLLSAYGEQWLAPLRGPGEPLQRGFTQGQFRRGFVEVVWMPCGWFLQWAKVLLERTPLRELRITRTQLDELAALMASDHLPRLNALDLSDRRWGDDMARLLTKRPSITAIRTLRLRACGLTDVSAYRLAETPFDWPLRELDVAFNDFSPAGIAALQERFGHVVRTK
ncbi:MAG: TIGR02996 domain-containing protein [Gemmataceae bacterium]|nr:TIGR02996 domain-containing protein [Gemmata sp.]MDW8199484.1 TIGR02996 domain-containing protein [Gemmataceae bacterium]